MNDYHLPVEAVFAGKDPTVLALYARPREALADLGPCQEEPKSAFIHLVHRVGFAGIQPRQAPLVLNLRAEQPIVSPRVVK